MTIKISGWQEFSGKCYKWHKPPATWDKAKATCQSYPSGNLVIIESSLHSNWLLQMARNKPFWLGTSSHNLLIECYNNLLYLA